MADRTVTVRLRCETSRWNRELAEATAHVAHLRQTAEGFDGKRFTAKLDVDTSAAAASLRKMQGQLGAVRGKDVNVGVGNIRRQTGEVRALGAAITALGPAGIAAGAVAGGALLGLSGSIGVVAAAAGTSIAAFQGVGDALSAMKDYAADPSAESLQKLELAMSNLTVEGQRFARYLDSLRPQLRELRNVAQAGLLPGVEIGLREVMNLLPQVGSLVDETARAMSDLAVESGRSFNSAGARDYIAYLETRARPVLDALVRSTMDVGRGVAGMLRGFDVAMGDDILGALRNITAEFGRWGENLRFSTALHEFGDYVRRVGPQVGATLGAIASAVAAVAEAAGPIGPVVLGAIRGIATAVEAIASSGAGPVLVGVASGLGAINLALKGAQALKGSALVTTLAGVAASGGAASGAAGKLAGALRGLGPLAVVAALALGGISLAYDQVKSKAAESAEAVVRGTMTTTQAFDQELRRLRDRKAIMQGMTEGAAMGQAIGELTGKIDANAVALAEEAEAWRLTYAGRQEYLAGLAPVERAAAAATFAQDDYNRAVADFGLHSAPATAALRGLNDANRAADIAQRAAATGTDVHTASLNRQRDLMLGAIDTQLGWHSALLRATESVKTNGATLDWNTQAGLANRQTLQDLTRAAIADIDAKRSHTGSTEEVTRATDGHRQQLFDTARQMGMSETAAWEYVNQLNLTPPSITTDVRTPGLTDAIRNVTDMNVLMRDLDGGSMNVAITRQNLPRIMGRASGGPVHGPGTSTSDSIMTRLSDGEWVIKASTVADQGHGKLAALNAGQAEIVPRGMVPGRAAGGPVNNEIVYDFSALAASLKQEKDMMFPPGVMMMGGNGDAGQLGNARIIGAVARAMGFGRHGLVVALATALQESGLRNLNYGDRDSVGLFQQRTSQGWGSIAQIMNPGYSASKFFQALRGVRGWERMPITVAAQRVQRSAFPNAYAKWVGLANSLASQVGFHNGGVIPGTGMRDDKMIAAQSGERVLTRTQNREFERLVDVIDSRQLTPVAQLAGAVRGGDGGTSPVITNNFENHFTEAVDIDLFSQRFDFAVRSAGL